MFFVYKKKNNTYKYQKENSAQPTAYFELKLQTLIILIYSYVIENVYDVLKMVTGSILL